MSDSEFLRGLENILGCRNLTEEDIKTYCQGLARYKRPRRIFFDDVPRNPTGKIEKPKLRAEYKHYSNREN